MKRLPYIIFLTVFLLAACGEEDMLTAPESRDELGNEFSEYLPSDSVPDDSTGWMDINMPINRDRGTKPGQTKIYN